jgi:acrylyl-CoA reductase (NADPH)
MQSNKGLWIFNDGDKGTFQTAPLHDLKAKQVRIRSEYSSINYKDALGVSGKGKIFKTFPIVPGIDVAGTVQNSESTKFKVGDKVLVTGCGLGETFSGGYQEYVDVSEEHVIAIPLVYSSLDAMLIGTAGFTAGLALLRMEQLGQKPELGPILVTGASGGVGSMAVKLFSKRGYEVIAQSDKADKKNYLYSLGAKKVLNLTELALGTRPLESVSFGGAIDNIGGETLPKIAAHTNLYGNIASIGLASGATFSASVMPQILRGVSIVGISSTNAPRKMREEVWSLVAKSLTVEDLASVEYKIIGLEDIPKAAEAFFQRQVTGRIIVKIANPSARL